VAVTDEIDLFNPGSSIGHSGAGEQSMHRPVDLVHRGIDRVPLGQGDVDCLDARQ
jgi:hypothetical protein